MDESRFDLLPGLVKEFLAGAWDRGVRIERLPPYAPDLNPVEGAWQHLKLVEMRNLVCLDLEELHLELHLAIGRSRQKPRLIQSFFEGAGLGLERLSSLRDAQYLHSTRDGDCRGAGPAAGSSGRRVMASPISGSDGGFEYSEGFENPKGKGQTP